jgi:multimeric flavodoxin WrbA
MKVIAINASPRKKWNTATLLAKVIEGAVSQGAEASLVHLYDLQYKGCISCFACKTRGGESYGTCAIQDDLTPVYRQIKEASALVLGSPVYFGDVTGAMRSFLERLLFPYLVYDHQPRTLFPAKIRTVWIYTMNAHEETAKQRNYDRLFSDNESLMRMIFGRSESLMSYNTYQFPDYSKVVADRFDVVQKEKRRREVFPKDCQKAYDMGASLVAKPAWS